MGSHQVFCLRWSNHQSNMLSVFDELLQTEALVDVTIACEGLSLKAHKVVLSACSPYFQALFVQNPCKHPIVILKDIKYTELKSLVDFMYKGEVNVTKEQLSALLKTAETLKIKGLAEVTGGVNGQHEPAESLSRLTFPNAAERGLPLLGNSSGGSQQGLLVSEESGSRSPPPLPLHTIPYHKSANVGGVGGGGSSSSTGRSIRSPLPKRKKTRHRKRSSDGASAPDSENVSSVDVRGSPEMIVAKVEVSDDYDNVPPGMGDTDEGGKLSVDQGDDSNDESMDNLYTSQGPGSNPADEEYSAMDDPMSSSSQTPISLIQKLKTSGPSTSLTGSNQGPQTDHQTSPNIIPPPVVLPQPKQEIEADVEPSYPSGESGASAVNVAPLPRAEEQADEVAESNCVETVQGGQPMYSCPECSKTFKVKYNVFRHQRTSCVLPREMHECFACRKVFSRRDKLIRHLKGRHKWLDFDK